MAHHPEGPWGSPHHSERKSSGDVATFIGLWTLFIVSMITFGISAGHIAENPVTGEIDIEKGWENALRISQAGIVASALGSFLQFLFFVNRKNNP